jgi:hypothetical protein
VEGAWYLQVLQGVFCRWIYKEYFVRKGKKPPEHATILRLRDPRESEDRQGGWSGAPVHVLAIPCIIPDTGVGNFRGLRQPCDRCTGPDIPGDLFYQDAPSSLNTDDNPR